MSLNENIYMTGLGSLGLEKGNTSSEVEKFIPGKKGSRVVVNRLNANNGAVTSSMTIVCMRVLETEEVSAGTGASGTSVVDIGTSLGLVIGDSAEFGDASDTLAANDVVAIELDDGTYHFDYVSAVVATDGTIQTDTAISGAFSTGNKVFLYGSTANNGHIEFEASSANAGAGDTWIDCAVGRSKGDPMPILVTASSTGETHTLRGVVYSYVNK